MNIYEVEKSDTTSKPNITVLFVYTLLTFCILTLFLFAIDFVPELRFEPRTDSDFGTQTSLETSPLDTEVTFPHTPQVPVRITVPSIGLDTNIVTPSSSDINVLDSALLTGAVLYPNSGLLNENTNMLIFGHSSYLPVVKNKAFKAFNELGKVTQGDSIIVYSDTATYTYRVESVELREAEDVVIDFTSLTPRLTLATCNTFGKKQERWVVEATLVTKELEVNQFALQ